MCELNIRRVFYNCSKDCLRTLLSPSSETQGQLVGAGKNTGEEKSRTRERAPGDKVLTEQFQTVRVALAFDWCQKTFVFFCLIKEQED